MKSHTHDNAPTSVSPFADVQSGKVERRDFLVDAIGATAIDSCLGIARANSKSTQTAIADQEVAPL